MENVGLEVILVLLIALLPVLILLFASMWKIYVKAGYEGWNALIPIYSTYILTKIIGKPAYWVALMLIPYLNLIFFIWAMNLLVKGFGKGVGFTLGVIFLPLIFLPILAFGSAQWQGSNAVNDQVLDADFV